MSESNIITAEELEGRLAMAVKGVRANPDLMRSAAGYMELVHSYVNRIVTARSRPSSRCTKAERRPHLSAPVPLREGDK